MESSGHLYTVTEYVQNNVTIISFRDKKCIAAEKYLEIHPWKAAPYSFFIILLAFSCDYEVLFHYLDLTESIFPW